VSENLYAAVDCSGGQYEQKQITTLHDYSFTISGSHGSKDVDVAFWDVMPCGITDGYRNF
jgi:hypothetical protein